MAVFQEVCQLVAVTRVDRHLQGMGGLGSFLLRPAFLIVAVLFWRMRLDFFFGGRCRFGDGLLHAFRCRFGIGVEFFHHGIDKAGDFDFSAHQVLSFTQKNLIARFLKDRWSIFSMS
ncbi:hypothetical protein IV72_GL001590 [Atopobium minutum]|nr:hypothetical protein IV72_GL001590 [Atopobium minutum]